MGLLTLHTEASLAKHSEILLGQRPPKSSSTKQAFTRSCLKDEPGGEGAGVTISISIFEHGNTEAANHNL